MKKTECITVLVFAISLQNICFAILGEQGESEASAKRESRARERAWKNNAIIQWEGVSTVLVSWDIKQLTWYGCHIVLTWSNLGTVNIHYRIFLVRFSGRSVSFGRVMGILGSRTVARQNSTDMSSKRIKKARLGIKIGSFLMDNLIYLPGFTFFLVMWSPIFCQTNEASAKRNQKKTL